MKKIVLLSASLFLLFGCDSSQNTSDSTQDTSSGSSLEQVKDSSLIETLKDVEIFYEALKPGTFTVPFSVFWDGYNDDEDPYNLQIPESSKWHTYQIEFSPADDSCFYLAYLDSKAVEEGIESLARELPGNTIFCAGSDASNVIDGGIIYSSSSTFQDLSWYRVEKLSEAPLTIGETSLVLALEQGTIEYVRDLSSAADLSISRNTFHRVPLRVGEDGAREIDDLSSVYSNISLRMLEAERKLRLDGSAYLYSAPSLEELPVYPSDLFEENEASPRVSVVDYQGEECAAFKLDVSFISGKSDYPFYHHAASARALLKRDGNIGYLTIPQVEQLIAE